MIFGSKRKGFRVTPKKVLHSSDYSNFIFEPSQASSMSSNTWTPEALESAGPWATRDDVNPARDRGCAEAVLPLVGQPRSAGASDSCSAARFMSGQRGAFSAMR